jgi:hypothetical protein
MFGISSCFRFYVTAVYNYLKSNILCVLLQDIVEDCIDDKLDNNHFPFLSGQRQGSSLRQAPNRYATHQSESSPNVQSLLFPP